MYYYTIIIIKPSLNPKYYPVMPRNINNKRISMEELNKLNEEVLKISDLITIDPYYTTSQYNESLQALKNNGIEYSEWISTLAPFEFYLDLDGQKPIMMNYDTPSKTVWNKLVSKVKPLKTNDEVLLYRRGDKLSNVKDYINNDVFSRALKEEKTIVFNYKNKEQLLNLSKTYGVIYPIGKYLRGSRRLAICFDVRVKNVITPSDLMLEMGKHKIGELEIKINRKVLREQDKIIKWVHTPKYVKGKFMPTKPNSPMKI